MKGIAKLQLIDPKTKKVKKEIIEENILTNGPVNFCKFRSDAWYTSIGFITATSYLNVNSIADELDLLYKGVVLFGETLTEDTNNYFLSSNPEVIGYAGGDYAGLDPFRGDYNETESVVDLVAKTATIVFDFGTDKANGDIDCVCLCPEDAGRNGWGKDQAYLSDDAVAACMIAPNTRLSATARGNAVTQTATGLNDEGKLLGDLESDGHMWHQTREDGTIEVYKAPFNLDVTAFNPFDSKILEDLILVGEYTETYTDVSLCGYNGTLYAIEHNTSTNVNYLYTVDKSTLAKTLVFALDGTADLRTSYAAFASIANDKIYLLGTDASTIYVYNLSTGAFIESLTTPNSETSVNSIGIYNDMLLVNAGGTNTSYDYACRCYTHDGTSWSNVFRGAYMDDATTQPPFKDTNFSEFLILQCNDNQFYKSLDLRFLSSINNLGSTLTKTSSDELKVTYTLDWSAS